MFGDLGQVEANRARRESVVGWVDVSEGLIVVVQSGAWTDAEVVRFAGVTLLDADAKSHSAAIELAIDGVCKGVFMVTEDASIGRDTRILAIADDAILLESEGELRYLAEADAQILVDVVWSSPFEVARARAASGLVNARQPGKAR